MTDKSVEKRIFKRIKVECTAKGKKGDEEFPIQITNISGHGIGFRTQYNLRQSERLMIIISMSSTPEPLIVTGAISWVKHIGDNHCSVGILLDMTSWIKMSKVLG